MKRTEIVKHMHMVSSALNRVMALPGARTTVNVTAAAAAALSVPVLGGATLAVITGVTACALSNKFRLGQRIFLSRVRLPGTGQPSFDSLGLLHTIGGQIDRFTRYQPRGATWGEAEENALQNARDIGDAGDAPAAPPRQDDPARVIGAQPIVEQIDWKKKAQEEIAILASKASTCASLYLIQMMLGEKENLDAYMALTHMISSAPEDAKPSLWTLYRQKLGTNFSNFQIIQAAFWYAVFYQTGLINVIIELYLKNIHSVFDSSLNGEQRDPKLKKLLTQIVALTTDFLKRYNRQIESAKANPSDPQLLDDRIRVLLDNLNKAPQEVLNQDLCKTAISLFPELYLFRRLEESKFSFLIRPLNLFIGTPINWAARAVVRIVVPKMVPKLVETVLGEKQNIGDTNRPFATAMAKTLTSVFAKLKEGFRDGLPSGNKQSSSFGEIDGLELFIKTLYATLNLTSPPDTAVLAQNALARGMGFDLQGEFEKGTLVAVQASIEFFATHPELTKELFNNAIKLVSDVFAKNQENTEYLSATTALKRESSDFFATILRSALMATPKANESFQIAHATRKKDATRSFQDLVHISRTMEGLVASAPSVQDSRFLTQLDGARKTIGHFRNDAIALDALCTLQSVKDGLDASFGPIYQDVVELTNQLLEFQNLYMMSSKSLDTSDGFEKIRATIQGVKDCIAHQNYDQALVQLDSFEDPIVLIEGYLPPDAPIPAALRQSIQRLRMQLAESKRIAEKIENLKSLRQSIHWIYQISLGKSTLERRGVYLNQIRSVFQKLDPKVATELSPLIDQFTLKQGDLSEHWNKIEQIIANFRAQAESKLSTSNETIATNLSEMDAQALTQGKFYTRQATELHAKLQSETRAWSTQVAAIQDSIVALQPEKQRHLSIPGPVVNGLDNVLGVVPRITRTFDNLFALLTKKDIIEGFERIGLYIASR